MPRKTGNPSIVFPEPSTQIVQLTVGNEDLVDIKDVLDDSNFHLRSTHLGHELHLWDAKVDGYEED